MLYSSKDLLFIVLAFCILWFTIFVSWVLYYVAMIFRDAYKMFAEFRQRLNLIDQFVHSLTEKLERTSSSLTLLVEGFGRLVSFLQERNASKKRKREEE